MCEGGRLVADFVAGTSEKPDVPDLSGSLTTTLEGAWVVWAYKLARQEGDHFIPCRGIGSYPAEAQAECAAPGRPTVRAALAARGAPLPSVPHSAPDLSCTCGFYALSDAWAEFARRLELRALGLSRRSPGGPFGQRRAMPFRGTADKELFVDLTVVLSGRVLAFEWPDGGFLFRAARQTVVRVDRWPDISKPDEPDDLGGHSARIPGRHPFGAGPVRLPVPEEPLRVAVRDDAGGCGLTAVHVNPDGSRLSTVQISPG
jgi:hypothetical protein